MTAQDYMAPESIGRLQQRALGVAVVGAILCLIGWLKWPSQFFHSYLVAYLFVLGLSLGSMGLLMLQHLTSGHWGIIIRRPLEAAMRTLWLVALLFVPVIFGMKYIYGAWLNAPATGEGALSIFEKTYLTTSNFIIRAVIYFAVWLVLVAFLERWSRQQDVDTANRALRRKFKMLSGPGIILYVFGVGFASIDWAMSLSPHWFSTIYGFIFVVGEVISALCLVIAMCVLLARSAPMAGLIQARHLSDLGKLLHLCHAMGLFFVFAVADHLVRKSAGRDQLLSQPPLRKLGRGSRDCSTFPFFRALFHVAFTRPEAQRQPASQGGLSSDCHAPGRSFLDDAPGVYFQRPAQLV